MDSVVQRNAAGAEESAAAAEQMNAQVEDALCSLNRSRIQDRIKDSGRDAPFTPFAPEQSWAAGPSGEQPPKEGGTNHEFFAEWNRPDDQGLT